MTKKMSARALKALKASIMAWKNKAVAGTPDEVLLGPGACPFCRLYYRLNCGACPIRAKTTMSCCVDTPYIDAFLALLGWRDDPSNTYLRDKWREAAKAEIAFLESLLPEGEAVL